MAIADTPHPSVRVLVVDDFEPWRRSVCSIFKKQPDVQVVGEAADGWEAVQKAQTLKPDLILLDIGLPNLTGIEAANRIHQLVPGTKIIFITANNDKEVVRAALRTGAQGYVLKVDAGTQLLTAVAGVVGGDDFVSSGIKRSDSVETKDTVMTKPCPICKRQLVKKEPTDTVRRVCGNHVWQG